MATEKNIDGLEGTQRDGAQAPDSRTARDDAIGRRKLLKSAWVAPAVLAATAVSARASAASGDPECNPAVELCP